MTEDTQTPQEGVADAIGGLSEQTRLLIRHELDAARQEVWTKAKAAAPDLTLLGMAAVLGLFATAAAYRFSLRVLESRLPNAAAAALASAGYGLAAGWMATSAVRALRTKPAPLPKDTARETAAGVAEAASGEQDAATTPS